MRSGISHADSTLNVVLSSVTLSDRNAGRVTMVFISNSLLIPPPLIESPIQKFSEHSSRYSRTELVTVLCSTGVIWKGKFSPSSSG